MSDLAVLGIKIDSTQAGKAEADLDKLAVTGAKTEAALDKLGNEAAQAGQQMKTAAQQASEMAAAAQQSAAAAMEAARAQAGYAAQANAVRAQLDPMFAAQQRFNTAMDQADDLLRAGAITAREYAAAQQFARTALQQHAQAVAGAGAASAQLAPAMGAITATVGQQRAGMQQLAFNIQDVGVQMGMAAQSSKPFTMALTSLSQQIPQLVSAVALMTGQTKGFIGFMGGPWGAVLMGAVTILGSLGVAYANAKNETKDSERAQRSFTEVLGDAKSSWEELRKAAKEYADQQAKNRVLTLEQIQTEGLATQVNLKRAISERAKYLAELETAKLRAEVAAQSDTGGGEGYALALRNLAQVDTKIRANVKAITELERAVNEITISAADAIAELNTDPSARLKAGFDVLRNGARSSIRDLDELTKRLGALNDGEEAALERLAESGKKKADEALKLAKVTGDEIARALGTSITSGLRSARQNAAVNGAANSYHLTGQAIDIPLTVNGKPLTKAGIRAALEPMGVQIKELLGPGDKGHSDHFHIAFAIDRLKPDEVRRFQEDAAEAAEKAATAAALAYAKKWAELFEMQDSIAKTLVPQFDQQAAADWERMFAEIDKAIHAPTEALLEFYDAFGRLKDLPDELDFGSIFGNAGDAIRDMAESLDELADAQREYGEAKAKAEKLQGPEKAVHLAKLETEYNEKKLYGTVQMLSATKRLFAEQSAGYRIIEVLEKAAAARALVNTAIHVAQGAAKMFASLGPFGFAAVAAMMAVMAAVGFKGGGSSPGYTPPSADDVQGKIGTGTVFGDSQAQSESLANALDIIASNSNEDLEYSNEAVRHLRSIDDGINALTGKIGQELGLSSGSTGIFSTKSFNLGSSGSSGFLGLFGSSTTRTLYDQGLRTFSQTVGDLLMQGVDAQVYNIIEQVKKSNGFLGIGGGTKTSYQTVTGALPNEIAGQVQLIVQDVASSIVAFGRQIGVDVSESIKAITIPGADLSFKDMSGEEIEKALQAYFSSVADSIAVTLQGALPLSQLQRAGEGLYETLARVVKDMTSVDVALRSINMRGLMERFGGAQTNAAYGAINLTDKFGGLEGLQDAIDKFGDNFLSEAERMTPIISAVNAEMARLGQSGITTNEQFKTLVQGLDLSTEAGQEMFAQLLAVAPAFAKVNQYLAELNGELEQTGKTAAELAAIEKSRRAYEIQIMELEGRTQDAINAQRADALAILDASLRPMQEYVWSLQDAAAAAAEATRLQGEADRAAEAAAAVALTTRNLEIALMEAQGNAQGALNAKRQLEVDAASEADRAIVLMIHAAQDAAEAAQEAAAAQDRLAEAQRAAAQAAREQQQAINATVTSIFDIQAQIAALDPNSNVVSQSLQFQRDRQIAAAEDAVKPWLRMLFEAQDAAKAREAQEARVNKWLEERRSLQQQLMELEGNSLGSIASIRNELLAALDPANRAMQQQVWALQDQQKAAEAAAAAAEKARQAAEAAAREAEAAQREREQRIDEARRTLADSYNRESSALKETIDRFSAFGKELREFKSSLSGVTGFADQYRRAQGLFVDTASAARMGDADALGKLSGVAKEFLDASMNRASSALEYNRDVARVKRALDDAIGATDEAVNYAMTQQAALDKLVEGQDLGNDVALSTLEALNHLNLLLGGEAVPLPAAAPVVTSGPAPTTNATTSSAPANAPATLEAMNAQLVQVNGNLTTIKGYLRGWNRGTSVSVSFDTTPTVAVA